MKDLILQWDTNLLLALNGSDSLFWDGIMMTATKTFTWIPLMCLLLYVVFKNNDFKVFGLTILFIALLILIADQTASGICKPYFQRLRPSHNPELYSLIDTVDGYRAGRFGFFSSHAANTFSVAMFLTLVFRKATVSVVLFLYAIFCSYTRIYLGVHYPLDILTGLFYGIFIGYLLYIIYKHIQYRISPNRNFYSSAYTKSGYLLEDLRLIPLGFAFTLIYIAIKGVYYASQL